MPNAAADLTNCDEEVPLLGVTREFDFGQFIELFDSTPDEQHPEVPLVARVVIQPSSRLAADRNAATGAPSTSSAAMTAAPAPDSNSAARELNMMESTTSRGQVIREAQEVDVFDLTEHGPGAKLAPIHVEIKDRDSFFDTGQIKVNGESYKVPFDANMREELTMGFAINAFATSVKKSATSMSIPVSLALPFETVELSDTTLAQMLAGNNLVTGTGHLKPVLTTGAIRTLLTGGTVLTHGIQNHSGKAPVALYPPATLIEPISERYDVFDVPSFIANPGVLATNGALLPVTLDTTKIMEMTTTGRTQIDIGGHSVELNVLTDEMSTVYEDFLDKYEELVEKCGNDIPLMKPPGMTWDEYIRLIKKERRTPFFVDPYDPDKDRRPGGRTSGGGGETTPSMTDKVQPRLPTGTGLAVAVFVPWKQTWTLKGFSRGNLLHSIALAPLEQVTLQVFSWERRTRSLDQSSETDVEQATEVAQTTRDTEDVFREMIAKHDFAWQLSGSLDASYSNGVASIQVGLNGSVSDTTSIQQTARNSSQHVRESAVKATSRVRSKRVTRIMQTVESGREERVTRLVQNPNQCHTLTLDFFETLAHYEIKLEFVKHHLRLVVLIPNPINCPDFISEIVRRNETTLRNALIEPALEDGFEACRMVAAYDEARGLLSRQQSEAAKLEELKAQRDKPAATAAPDPSTPQQAEVERVVNEMIAALQKIRAGAEIDTAMVAIRDWDPVSEDARRKGQQWLFISFCAAKFPSLLATLDELARSSIAAIAAAQKILAVLPRPDSPTNLGNLNQMSDKDKEESCLASKLKEERNGSRVYMKADWDWAWWSGRLKDEGLYTSNDGGLGGLADQLQKAYQAWEAKKAQGNAMKDQEVAKTEAEGRQDKATSDDKLSMAFPLDELARAYERSKVLRDHLNEHREFYNYALFQALPPSEQALRIVEASNGRLQVGLFEPRVVAMNGSRLAVPLTPFAGSQELQDFVTNLSNDLETAFNAALATSDTAILPTPGVNVSSRLGKCSSCEDYIETAREHELARLEALAQQEQYEAERRKKRIDAKNYDDFRESPPAVKLEVENKTPITS